MFMRMSVHMSYRCPERCPYLRLTKDFTTLHHLGLAIDLFLHHLLPEFCTCIGMRLDAPHLLQFDGINSRTDELIAPSLMPFNNHTDKLVAPV